MPSRSEPCACGALITVPFVYGFQPRPDQIAAVLLEHYQGRHHAEWSARAGWVNTDSPYVYGFPTLPQPDPDERIPTGAAFARAAAGPMTEAEDRFDWGDR